MRADQLTADCSRRAGEVELERMRREHEDNQVKSVDGSDSRLKKHRDITRKMETRAGFARSTHQQQSVQQVAITED